MAGLADLKNRKQKRWALIFHGIYLIPFCQSFAGIEKRMKGYNVIMVFSGESCGLGRIL
jgi:hypothetical protein